ncbi:hypothetical protein LTR37_010989 [Vermiconidia calcicola]|uniref:Uncharacterized protein n=1 Tax=Vermiconidia calcicola TaxID=1690605 RepID=A0ACC3N3M4_9PEZI|nr:hypothetical protein LTR37_010989 [Vermiconidia calcicola]
MDDDRPRDEASRGEELQHPLPAHVREEEQQPEQRNHSDDELEATELRPINHDKPRLSRVITPNKPMVLWYDPVKRFWRHQIRISVPHVDCRDHLGYLRTSIALSMLGTIIAQLYRLQHHPNPSKVFGYYVLSKPLSVIFQCAALAIVLIGGIRFWRQQSAMAIGKVHASGWELISIAIGSFLLLFMMFVIHVGIDIYKQEED